MPAYSIATAALALGVPRKALENLVPRCRMPGLSAGKQGSSRRLNRNTVVRLAAVLQLREQLGLSAAQAASLLPAGGATPPTHTVCSGALSLTIDFEAIARVVDAGLATALEVAPRPRRGRPRAS